MKTKRIYRSIDYKQTKRSKISYNKKRSTYYLHYEIACALGEMLNSFIENYSVLEEIPIKKQNEDKSTFTKMPTREDIIKLRQNGHKLVTILDFLECI